MDQIELFRQIVASCDEALKDVFLRRMEASVRIAQSKFQEGVPVYSQHVHGPFSRTADESPDALEVPASHEP